MTRKCFLTALSLVAVTLASVNAWSSQFNVIYKFPDVSKGFFPLAVISDSSGNLYGTTMFGGVSSGNGWGVIYKLTQNGGTWTEDVLYEFTGGTDGGQPAAGLTMDASGNLYGTTSAGGDPSCNGFCGVVFELKHNQGGTWSQSVLHQFTGPDGLDPQSGLAFDTKGNLYGTTYDGGAHGNGTVFQLSPNGDGTWKYTILFSFGGHNPEHGLHAVATPVFDASGNLYGTTTSGGDMTCGGGIGCGTIFQLAPQGNGQWEIGSIPLHGNHGGEPVSLIFDESGNLFGAAFAGGPGMCQSIFENGCGTILELSPTAGGWQASVPHVFFGNPASNPVGVVPDAQGNLYGATESTGLFCGNACGTLFKLSKLPGNGWGFSVLHKFQGGTDGFAPFGPPILASDGNVYGATQAGGDLACISVGCGVIYQIIP